MSTVGCEYHLQFLLNLEIALKSRPVGAMFYVSPTLTMLMLAVVPPVSLGAVCFVHKIPYLFQINSLHWQFFYGRYLKKLSNQTQEAIGDMTKVCKSHYNLLYPVDVRQVASEALSALRTVQSYNAVPQEERKFHDKVSYVLTLARREAIASGIFFGSTGWSGNVTLLGLLGYGRSSESGQYWNGLKNQTGGTLVSHGDISVGDLTSLLLYTVYVGNGLQMLTWALSLAGFEIVKYWNHIAGHFSCDLFIFTMKLYRLISIHLVLNNARDWRWNAYFWGARSFACCPFWRRRWGTQRPTRHCEIWTCTFWIS